MGFFQSQEYRDRMRRLITGKIEAPLARMFAKVGFSPNKITFLGLLISALAAYQIVIANLIAAGILLIVGSFLDMIDGALARLQGKSNLTGALIDSSSDRLSEALIFLGLLIHYANKSEDVTTILVYIALVFSFMVSYLRARGEGLGVDCKVGFMTRPERVIVLAIGLLSNNVVISLWVIAILSFITSLHRFWHIRNTLPKY